MICKQCKKEWFGETTFCSRLCRNIWVSDLMVKKAKKIKKDVGNSYYYTAPKDVVKRKKNQK